MLLIVLHLKKKMAQKLKRRLFWNLQSKIVSGADSCSAWEREGGNNLPYFLLFLILGGGVTQGGLFFIENEDFFAQKLVKMANFLMKLDTM